MRARLGTTTPPGARVLGLLLATAGMTCVAFALADIHPEAPQAPRATVVSSQRTVALPQLARVAAPPGSPPVRLVIPAIGVSTPLLGLGKTASGELEVPAPGPHYDQAGWYRYSPAPGSLGPAVIVGHVDSAAGGPSVFFRLGALRPLDRVRVDRQDGTVAVFVVDSVARYPKAAFPTQLVYGNTGFPALRLITCGGPFDRTTGHYQDNVVVLAHLAVRNTAGPRSVARASSPI